MTTFSTSRQYAATPAAVFAAMKDPARLARWWGPDGFSNCIDVFEFHTGGKWIFTMIGPDGTAYPNESVFSSIEADRELVIRHTKQPHFQLKITLEPSSNGTLLRWVQTFADAAVADAMRHIVVPANEQNLNRLDVELGLSDTSAA